jgi:hypothetical protein
VITVKATNEGLAGKATASGYVIDLVVCFVALPSEQALGAFVRLWNPLNNARCIAQVLDVGPWHTNDNDYVFGGARPAAELQSNTNGSGIDLGGKAWALLGMIDNTEVGWEFVS